MTDTTEVHFRGKVAQKAIIVHNDKVLLMRDSREVDEIWEIPGGRLNEGEEPKAGLARELQEELGVACVVHDVVYLEQFFQGNEKENALMIAYTATMLDPEAPFVLPPEEVAEVRWVGKDEWHMMHFFPEYKRALAVYFAKS